MPGAAEPWLLRIWRHSSSLVLFFLCYLSSYEHRWKIWKPSYAISKEINVTTERERGEESGDRIYGDRQIAERRIKKGDKKKLR